ncbi:hypothetical protein A2697_00280 [Candidatus Curtissbacteria bacterium RIFCSPHIGHO2_01_FULL_41_44]|uniref:HIT domain-containing protein n=1 Tax=Candidatus Curtissbacteria bacterium RIFCSPLOWO2_01_FULL_42_50 TaxID=1797730 RepID=A0A1F5H235_9BACT|nr:MAG: hypothetical protein A2697_00280 [Candidatus Curtissbacteria bacterium RIFCSPHIGHO2_01_FULL_41_44]OGD92651.1 MAG: hypothetical protein A3C33_03420 [Candidatus Curtissbacteria bacterium RIFCSPHIGHO2_02_FULL_42_58]OGD96395.1 MAG: hypothetical protein A3E71_05005 [Candidatus Curtissbacteria bacterium RIFCSPHIGHO2_12_FULL_42_33]OGD98206.1 MAG: hypothetical protein A3B54_02225 [Candidatus Curtissbacteria bacterium RIFCSPLOWO2_01_FULL_42_50]OGE02805.1 MAG: hypothetical protein A3G16_03180 [Ca
MTSRDCIFCKLINDGGWASEPILETDSIVAVSDINPVADVHILIIPKNHIESVLTIGEKDSRDIIEMFSVAQKIVEEKKLEAFRLAFNAGRFQHVPHLHMHLLAGGKVQWSKL